VLIFVLVNVYRLLKAAMLSNIMQLLCTKFLSALVIGLCLLWACKCFCSLTCQMLWLDACETSGLRQLCSVYHILTVLIESVKYGAYQQRMAVMETGSDARTFSVHHRFRLSSA